jgi:hypothetical protein
MLTAFSTLLLYGIRATLLLGLEVILVIIINFSQLKNVIEGPDDNTNFTSGYKRGTSVYLFARFDYISTLFL